MKTHHRWSTRLTFAATAVALAMPAVADDDDEGEIDVPVGITPSGQIGFAGFDFDELFGLDFEFVADGTDPAGLPFSGLFTDNPGFRDLVSAGVTPSADFAQPTGTFNFEFELLAIDAPLRMADPTFDNELFGPGSTFTIGDQDTLSTLGEIDSHPFFFIAESDIVVGEVLSVTGRVVDTTGNFSASESFTFNFLVPAPGATAAIGLAGLVTLRRRR
ncbi:MAG: hypothetical protein AAF937_03440 [Planctomycetota bacterium]